MTGRGSKEMKYRFQWTFPIQFSPHDSNVLYVTGNMAFRSTDEGTSWEAISPDLTRQDVTKMEPSGGPVTKDTSGAEVYGTIFAFVESPHEKGVFWAGSDDGLVHISRDGGEHWEQVTPSSMPPFTLVSMIEVSPHDPATAYIAATRYKLDEPRPMLYKTSDYGVTWTEIAGNIPSHDYTRVIREDPARRGLLYVGTETGVYVSFDDGGSWRPLQANLPTVPVYDLLVKENDLVAATHGRSFWVLDQLGQIQQAAAGLADGPFQLLKPAETQRLRSPLPGRKPASGKRYRMSMGADVTFIETLGPNDLTVRKVLDGGENPPHGVLIFYYLGEPPEEEINLTISDAAGAVIKTWSNKSPVGEQPNDMEQEPLLSGQPGMNRFVWDMRYPASEKVPGDKTTEDVATGPMAPPGAYEVRLSADGQAQTHTFNIAKDPRVSASQEDLDSQFRFLIQIRDKLSDTHRAIMRLRSVRSQVEEWEQRAGDSESRQALIEAAGAIKQSLNDIESELIQTGHTGARHRLHLPVKLNRQLAELMAVVGIADFAPPQQTYRVFEEITGRIDAQTKMLNDVLDQEVPKFMDLVHELEIPAIVPRPTP
jgi:hypothetical protein